MNATEKHRLVASRSHLNQGRYTPDQGLNHNCGVCPDWESNPRPFGYGTTLQPT